MRVPDRLFRAGYATAWLGALCVAADPAGWPTWSWAAVYCAGMATALAGVAWGCALDYGFHR